MEILAIKKWLRENPGNSGQNLIKSITFGFPQDSYISWSHQMKKYQGSEWSLFPFILSKCYEMIDNRKKCPELPPVWNYPYLPYI